MEIKLNILVFKEGDWWVAQCLEYDIATQAKTLHDIQYEFSRVLIGQVVASIEQNLVPFEGLPAAPKQYWKMFKQEAVKIEGNIPSFRLPKSIPSTYTIQPKEIRVC